MNKLIALGLMALSMNTALAADGNYTYTIDMNLTVSNKTTVSVLNQNLYYKVAMKHLLVV